MLWREAKERDLRDTALRAAGYDPANIDWKALEDPLDREAVEGAEWHTFWQTTNLDLHLIADELPEALHIGIRLHGMTDQWNFQNRRMTISLVVNSTALTRPSQPIASHGFPPPSGRSQARRPT
jgi:hypothetical protein